MTRRKTRIDKIMADSSLQENTVNVNQELWKLRTRPIPELMSRFGMTYDSVKSRLRRMQLNGGPITGDKVVEEAADAVLMSSPAFEGKLNKRGLTKVIVLPDMQVPYQNDHALRVVEEYMADHTWDYYINIGDFIDVEGISHFNKEKPRLSWGKELIKEYKVANRILDRHQAIIREKNKDAKFHLIFGNHEERVERWLDEHPQLSGLVEVPINLRLLERGFTWTRDGHMGKGITLGKAMFTHGLKIGVQHTVQMAREWGDNIFYGHTHDVQSYTHTTRQKDSTRIAQSLGCLCVYDLPYVQATPTRWQNAFAVFYFKPDGTFNHYVVNIVNDEFISPEGKHYY